jgi:hypothetical protein
MPLQTNYTALGARFKRTIPLSLTEFPPKNNLVFVPTLLTRPRNVVIFVVREMKGKNGACDISLLSHNEGVGVNVFPLNVSYFTA